jgi:soluble lytic murein transglycosylase-like protein
MTFAMRAVLKASLAAVMVLSVGGVPTVSLAKSKAKTHASAKSSHGKASKGQRARHVVYVAPRPSASFVARDAFYSGDFAKAYELAPAAGERWVAGLASYRMHSYLEAFQYFQQVAEDTSGDAWTRSGAAYWAARSAVQAGLPNLETPFLRMASENPWTFYGMIAERQLGLEPAATFATPIVSPEVRLREAQDPFAQLIRVSNPVPDDFAMQPVADVGGGAYPVPDLAPDGGFTMDAALVYALIRQESRFNADARSPVGAIGLMQLMPTTAALTAGDDKYRNDHSLLRDPAVNMRIGQDYLGVLANEQVGDDLLMVVAAYNGGPGAVAKARERAGIDADPLMQIETLPAKETREYVEKVVAGYWVYRRQFGEKTPSLDALAAGNRITVNFDRSQPAPGLQQASAVSATKLPEATVAASF